MGLLELIKDAMAQEKEAKYSNPLNSTPNYPYPSPGEGRDSLRDQAAFAGATELNKGHDAADIAQRGLHEAVASELVRQYDPGTVMHRASVHGPGVADHAPQIPHSPVHSPYDTRMDSLGQFKKTMHDDAMIESYPENPQQGQFWHDLDRRVKLEHPAKQAQGDIDSYRAYLARKF